MSLLSEIVKDLKENAAAGATAAHAVAAVPGGLFHGGVVTRNGKRMSNAYRMAQPEIKSLQKSIKNRNSMKWRIIGEMVEDDETFDAADVISKLDDAEKKSRLDQDTVPFGMEDEDGAIVKVYVRSEQADEFEVALAQLLAGEDENGDQDGETDSVEIAEVLFQLKDKFDIVDVEWPEIEGDEEEEQEMAADEMGMDFEGGDEEGGDEEMDLEGGDEDLDLEGEGDEMDDLEGDMEMEPEGGAEGALQQVIDMLKSQAEAQKVESEARAEEAKARAAEANASAASSKVKQEEEVLDMEAYNAQQKEEEEEAKRLAQLAKYKHDQASKAETKMAEEEEEASMKNDNEPDRMSPPEHEDHELTKNELGSLLLKYLRAN